MEVWKDIPGYEELYKVSSLGNIYNVRKKRISKLSICGGGYLGLGLHKDGCRKTKSVHILVAISFLGHIPDGFNKVIDHVDRNRSNNSVDNLRIVTQRENTNYNNTKGFYKRLNIYGEERFQSSIWENGKSKNLGYFDNEKDASRAYQEYKNKLNKDVRISNSK